MPREQDDSSVFSKPLKLPAALTVLSHSQMTALAQAVFTG